MMIFQPPQLWQRFQNGDTRRSLAGIGVAMKKTQRVNTAAGFWLAFLLFGLIVALSYKNVTTLVQSSEGRQHAVDTRVAIDDLSSVFENMGVERAAYLASGQARRLTLYYAAHDKVDAAVGTVKALVRDNAEQQRRLAVVESLVAQQRKLDQPLIDTYKRQGQVAAARVRTVANSGTREDIRRAMLEMSGAQERRLRELEVAIGVHSRNAFISVAAGSLIGMFVVVLSLAASRQQLARRRKAEEKVEVLAASLQQATDLVLVTNAQGKIEYLNRAAEETAGQPAARLIGKRRESLKVAGGDPLFSDLPETLSAGSPFQAVVDRRKKNGELVSLQETVTPIAGKDGSIAHVISTGRDITRQKRLEAEIDHVTNVDVLTGLPRRHVFINRLSQEISRLQNGSGIIAVMVLDVDRFKLINDVFGFEAGDEILKSIAARLRNSLGEGAFLARIGSDEFGAMAGFFPNTADVIPAVDKMMKHIARPLPVRGEDYFMTVTAGIVLCPEQGKDAPALIRNAGIALEQAKLRGRNNYQFYSPDMSARASEKLGIENSLFTALHNQEYVVNYQPYFELTTINIAGAEALIKWKRDKLGFVGPSEFIPTLENTGMIVDVGEWVLRTACRQLKEWDSKRPFFPVSVNLSGTQFRHRDLADMVGGVVQDFRLDPSLLTLEVTESIFIQDLDFAYGVLKKLKDIGISISVDDFGTGYSSLSYLKRLPVDNIKIDKSFVKDVAIDPDSASIVTAIVSMARNLNLKTIAEGIETEEQWKVLRLLRCDMGQGFYFSPALSPEEMERYS